MSVAICTPARDVVYAGYAKSLANLTARLSKTQVNFEVMMTLGSVIPQLRSDLVSIALEKNFEWILWLDSDMHFPDYLFERLVAHKKDIVAASYSTRVKPLRSVAFTNEHNYDERLTERRGLHPVFAVGMGCMLTHRRIFEQLPRPWFMHEWDPLSESLMGEDIYFCKYANNNGIEVYVDADLGKDIGHYGTKVFLLQETRDQ